MNGPFLLTMIWVVPFITALACLPVQTDDHRSIKAISLVGNLINLLLVIVLTFKFIAVSAANPVADGIA
ncbi:MAG: hypothetical protein D3922_08900, partial [Candidatus Electrothrix sp. AR1]|nr:hypothetical protein [Candidatus Electrothrix sp. AR1]